MTCPLIYLLPSFPHTYSLQMQFWRSGAFDVPWLGKAYFLISIVVSLVLTHWLGLFAPKSSTFLALRMAISLTGVMFLLASTPSIEICMVFLLMCLKSDEINHVIWQGYMQVAASPPTEYYTGKRLTKQEFEIEGRLETERALQKLKEFLTKNPDQMDVVCNHPVNLEKGTSTLMDRFVKGHYSGRSTYSCNGKNTILHLLTSRTFPSSHTISV